VKLLLENWQKYLKEDTEIFGYHLHDENEKVFLSDKIFTKINKVAQDVTPSFLGKPKGLWYSCGDDWIQWASSEMPGMINKANYLYKIEVNYDKIKTVHSEAEFTFLEKEYGAKSMIGGTVIDWKKLQDDGFAGIEICPYFNNKRYTAQWYYSWDVASGCIWDPAGLVDFKLLGKRESKNETPT